MSSEVLAEDMSGKCVRTDDGFIWRHRNIMGKGQPIITRVISILKIPVSNHLNGCKSITITFLVFTSFHLSVKCWTISRTTGPAIVM